MVNEALFSSNSIEYGTPIELFKQFDDIYHFETDVCARETNAKCKNFYSPVDDGLSQDWEGICWNNPPYGEYINFDLLLHENPEIADEIRQQIAEYKERLSTHKTLRNKYDVVCIREKYPELYSKYKKSISDWMKKAYESCIENNATVVCLVPSRTDTNWFHKYALKGEIMFIKGRLKFDNPNAESTAPFPSCVVAFNPETVQRD